jgi:response regulator of citrate/malate metabolism
MKILPPASMHGEERYNFFDTYRKKRGKTKRYKDIIDMMKKIYSGEEEKIREKIKKAEKKEDKSKLQLMKLCHQMYNDENLDKRERTFRKIGRKFGLSHITVKKYIEGYEEVLDKEEENV